MAAQDTYQYEEEQERLAMMKQLYLPMKNWFSGLDKSFCVSSLLTLISSDSVVQEKYPNFPSFWRDLGEWEHFRSLKKLYLAATEKTESGQTYDILELEKSILQNNNPPPQEDGAEGDSGAADAEAAANEEKKRKRRNRWGDAPPAETASPADFVPINATGANSTPAASGADSAGGEVKKPRKSRWSTAASDPSAVAAPGAPAAPFQVTAEIMQQTIVLQMQLKTINEKLMTVEQDAAKEELNPDRSPSPPPKYDSHGKRTNTRDVRMRETLTHQRTRTIEEMIRLNPLFQPPADFVRQKPFRRIYIPYKDHPNYNFIGLIIGPRGNTQKRMERETGCKISIRGKGSVKEGSKGRAAKQQPDEDDELHCFVQGETEENVEKAAKMVMELLVPQEDDKNEHKQKQLRELALINGTLREDEFCTVCGERGHKPFECPQRTKSFQAAGVRCAICGDQSHPTRDCPMKKDGPTNEVALDSEYNSFMAELGDGKEKGSQREASSDVVETVTEEDGVKVEKKGQQTVIHVKTLLTGTAAAPTPSPSQPQYSAAGYYGGYGASGAGQWSGYPPGAYGQQAAQWGQYYPGMEQQQQQSTDPAMAAYYGYNTAGATGDAGGADAAAQAAYYAAYYAANGYYVDPNQAQVAATGEQSAPPPPPSSGDVNMG